MATTHNIKDIGICMLLYIMQIETELLGFVS